MLRLLELLYDATILYGPCTYVNCHATRVHPLGTFGLGIARRMALWVFTSSLVCAMASKPIVIAGAGLHGSALAYYLTKRGEKPILIDRHSVAAAASGKGGCACGHSTPAPPTSLYLRAPCCHALSAARMPLQRFPGSRLGRGQRHGPAAQGRLRPARRARGGARRLLLPSDSRSGHLAGPKVRPHAHRPLPVLARRRVRAGAADGPGWRRAGGAARTVHQAGGRRCRQRRRAAHRDGGGHQDGGLGRRAARPLRDGRRRRDRVLGICGCDGPVGVPRAGLVRDAGADDGHQEHQRGIPVAAGGGGRAVRALLWRGPPIRNPPRGLPAQLGRGARAVGPRGESGEGQSGRSGVAEGRAGEVAAGEVLQPPLRPAHPAVPTPLRHRSTWQVYLCGIGGSEYVSDEQLRGGLYPPGEGHTTTPVSNNPRPERTHLPLYSRKHALRFHQRRGNTTTTPVSNVPVSLL